MNPYPQDSELHKAYVRIYAASRAAGHASDSAHILAGRYCSLMEES